MAELFDKEGNPITEVFDSEGNPLEETLTPDEVDQKIDEAKEEVQEEHQTELQGLQEKIDEKENELKEVEEGLEKEKEKDKNFGKLRKSTEDKEKESKELKEELEGLKGKIEGIEKNTKKQPVNAMIDKLAGNDEEMKKKIKFHYESFAIPADDNEEKQQERIKNAHILAGGQRPENPLSGEAISSGVGTAPGGGVEPKKKLSEGGKSVAEKLGVEEKDLRRHKLI